MVTTLAVDDIDAVVVGAALLGSGGGGSTRQISHPLRRALRAGPQPILELNELDGDFMVVPVGVIGSTQVFDEKLPGGDELSVAVHAIQRWTSRNADAVMGTEGGGLNGLTGLLAALDLDLPYVDVDLMGRALPRLNQFASAVAGLPVAPCAVAEPGGQVIVIDGVDPDDLERAARAIVSTTGGWGVIALPPSRARDLADACIAGSLARALTLGRAALALPPAPPREMLATALSGRVLGCGRVVDVMHRRGTSGFGQGSATLVDTDTHAVIRVETENEYLVAMLDGQVVATCPDIIAVLDRRDSAPVPVEALRPGVEVTLVVLPSPPWWLSTPERLSRVGPRGFDIDLDPVLVPQ